MRPCIWNFPAWAEIHVAVLYFHPDSLASLPVVFRGRVVAAPVPVLLSNSAGLCAFSHLAPATPGSVNWNNRHTHVHRMLPQVTDRQVYLVLGLVCRLPGTLRLLLLRLWRRTRCMRRPSLRIPPFRRCLLRRSRRGWTMRSQWSRDHCGAAHARQDCCRSRVNWAKKTF